jgi:hypothetical protein
MAGFHKPADDGKRIEVSIAVMSVSDCRASCSCGWSVQHIRQKVVEDRADKHGQNKHDGRMLWM